MVVVVVVVETAEGVTVVDCGGFAPLYDDDFSGEIDEWSGVDLVMVNAVDSSLGLLPTSLRIPLRSRGCCTMVPGRFLILFRAAWNILQ